MTATVGLGIIGGGLMGREMASAVARWMHLADIGVRPRIVHVADLDERVLGWYEQLDPAPARRSIPNGFSASRWRPEHRTSR